MRQEDDHEYYVRIWKEKVLALLRNYLGIRLEILRKTTKYLFQGGR
jgi:hypothetical protein